MFICHEIQNNEKTVLTNKEKAFLFVVFVCLNLFSPDIKLAFNDVLYKTAFLSSQKQKPVCFSNVVNKIISPFH